MPKPALAPRAMIAMTMCANFSHRYPVCVSTVESLRNPDFSLISLLELSKSREWEVHRVDPLTAGRRPGDQSRTASGGSRGVAVEAASPVRLLDRHDEVMHRVADIQQGIR